MQLLGHYRRRDSLLLVLAVLLLCLSSFSAADADSRDSSIPSTLSPFRIAKLKLRAREEAAAAARALEADFEAAAASLEARLQDHPEAAAWARAHMELQSEASVEATSTGRQQPQTIVIKAVMKDPITK
jgi:hypothetical protein